MKKILSIIIPTYNAEKFLDKGLQTYIINEKEKMDKLEVIVVNDGTPDNSVEIAQKYVNMYPGTFKIVNKENGGHGSAINTGAEHASGKYFKVVDADDWVNTEVLSEVIDILEAKDVDAVIASYESYDIEQKKFFPKTIKADSFGPYNLNQIVEKWEEFYWGLTFHGIIYNTQFYKNLNYQLIEKVFYEDQEYAAIPMSYAKTVGVIPKKLYVYRVGDVNQSVSFQSSLKRLKHYESVILRMGSAERLINQFAEGGKDYWIRKTSKFTNDYYELCLIRNPDKKQCRKRMECFNQKMKKQAPLLYGVTRKNFRIFWILNMFHVNEEGYQKRILPMIKKGRTILK